MKTLADFATIGSLILAIWMGGGLAKVERGKNPPTAPVTAGKLGVNHNEILVKDAEPAKREALPIEPRESIRHDAHPVHPRNCVWLECDPKFVGSMKIDTSKVRETQPQDSWTTSIWDFFFQESQRGSGCPTWMCGSNHNETTAKDSDPFKKAEIENVDERPQESWETPLWELLWGPQMGDTCPTLGCGENYNETMVTEPRAIEAGGIERNANE